MRILWALLMLVAPMAVRAQVTVTLDGGTTYQTIDGFGCNLRGGDNTNQTAPVLEALVGAGLTLFRVIQDEQDYMPAPGDHSVYGTGYFSNLVGTIAYLNQLGVTNGIHLNFMGTGEAWMVTGSGTSTFLALGQEDNWADMLGSLVAYLRFTNHLQFHLLEPENESDLTPGTLDKPRLLQSPSGNATGCVNAYRALAAYLTNNGLSDMRIIGLSSAFAHTDWVDTLLSDPVARSMVTHIGLHSYEADGAAGMGNFLQTYYPGTHFWMTEYSVLCSTCEGGNQPNPTWDFARDTANYLVNHLVNGATGCELFTGCDTWIRYLNSGSGGWSLWGAYGCDDLNAPFKTYSPRPTFYTLAQVSKYVKPGAQRLGVSGATAPLNLVAFRHPATGQLSLTGVNPAGDTSLSGTLTSLAAPTYLDLYYSTRTTNLAFGGSIPVTNGAFTLTIPADSVFTLTTVGPMAQILTAPPRAQVPPYGQLQFAATAADAAGSVVYPQPAFSWAVSGGGNIDANGLFSAEEALGGSYAVSASANGFQGLAQVSIVTNGASYLPRQTDRIIPAGAVLTVTNAATASSWVTQWVTNEFAFAYDSRAALLADGWSFVATYPGGATRNTEITDPAQGALISYDQAEHPGVLRIPCDLGDLWEGANNSRNSLFRSLPPNWVSLRLVLSFNPGASYQQAQFGLYQDDDNYLEVGLAYNGSKLMTLTSENGGVDSTPSVSDASAAGTNLCFQLDQSPAVQVPQCTCNGGTNWAVVGTNQLKFTNPRLFIWTGGAQAPYASGMPAMDLRHLSLVASNFVPRTLQYMLLGAPSGATIDSNGVITWTPSVAQAPSTNVFTTVVTDNGTPQLALTNRFTVVVKAPSPFPISSVVRSGDAVVITWDSVTGQGYRLQYKNTLAETNWQDVWPDIMATGPQTVATNAMEGSPCRFYRLRTVP
jgi:O-glycosyl hydrolase